MGNNLVKRITLDGILIAVFLVFSFFRIRVGNFMEIGFGSLIITLAAILLRPTDAIIIAFLGELVNQLFFTPYGITPTTALWVFPVVVRAAILSWVAYFFKKRKDDLTKHIILYFVTIMGTALLISGLDTGLLYLDGLIMGYPVSYTLLQTGMRFLTSQITAVIVALLALAIYKSANKLFDKGNQEI